MTAFHSGEPWKIPSQFYDPETGAEHLLAVVAGSSATSLARELSSLSSDFAFLGLDGIQAVDQLQAVLSKLPFHPTALIASADLIKRFCATPSSIRFAVALTQEKFTVPNSSVLIAFTTSPSAIESFLIHCLDSIDVWKAQYGDNVINLPGLKNLRDFGGYPVRNGSGRVKKGVLWRCAEYVFMCLATWLASSEVVVQTLKRSLVQTRTLRDSWTTIATFIDTA